MNETKIRLLESNLIDQIAAGEVVERPVIEKKLREKLINAFEEDISKLKEFTGYEFNEWFL